MRRGKQPAKVARNGLASKCQDVTRTKSDDGKDVRREHSYVSTTCIPSVAVNRACLSVSSGYSSNAVCS